MPEKKKRRNKRTLQAEFRLFVKEYLGACRFNGTEAVLRIRPNIKRKSAATLAYKWLGDARVQELLDKEYNRIVERIDLTTDDITREFQTLALFDIRDLCEWDEHGNVTFKQSAELTVDQARCIAGVTQHTSKEGTDTRFKVHDRIRGLEGLAKIKGLFGSDAPAGTAVLVLKNLHPKGEK